MHERRWPTRFPPLVLHVIHTPANAYTYVAASLTLFVDSQGGRAPVFTCLRTLTTYFSRDGAPLRLPY